MRVAAAAGPMARPFAHASVTKVAASIAVLEQVALGTCSLSDAAGPPGSTLEHLLSHAAGLPLDSDVPAAPPGARRIYSNRGIELAVRHAGERAGASDRELVDARVFARLSMGSTRLDGSPASGAVGSTEDLCSLAAELLVPELLPVPLSALQRSVSFPGLIGVLPGFGRQAPCDWGLGVEVKGAKHRHWTGPRWPATSFGHFGQAGGFLVVDPDEGIALVALGDEPFGPWAVEAWPAFTDAMWSAAST